MSRAIWLSLCLYSCVLQILNWPVPPPMVVLLYGILIKKQRINSVSVGDTEKGFGVGQKSVSESLNTYRHTFYKDLLYKV